MLELKNVSKHYQMGDSIIKALDDISLKISKGEFVTVMGPSGSGKSTFLQIASMLADPTEGKIIFLGKDVTGYSQVEAARLRNQEIGFVFQQFNLLARTSALDNVSLPLIYSNVSRSQRHPRAQAMLERVGLGDRLSNTPSQLSGGQQQRVAIARALVNNPSVIFADEPTGNLDSKSGEEIVKLLTSLHQEGKTIIMVTHEPELARIGSRLLEFKDGKLITDHKHKKND